MGLDLAAPELRAAAEKRPWERPEEYWPRLADATADRSAPLVALGVEALAWNAHDMLRRAGGLPIRVATKSLRVRGVLDAVLALPGYRGLLAYTLAEAVWLSERFDDILVAYPTADRAAIAALAGLGGSRRRGTSAAEHAAERVTVMVDDEDQLDLIDAVAPPSRRRPIRVCLDFDASWNAPVLGHVGVLRSPVRTPERLRALAEEVLRRQSFELVGVMSYEAQIAGVGDRPAGRPAEGLLMRVVQRASGAELAERRALAVAAVREIAELEFVNGGGTGSIEKTVAEGSITEVAAGSGLFGPHLFDHYGSFSPAPAVAIALDVVRRPNAETATLLGGGWIASGPAAPDRLPRPVWPEGLRYATREGAGEVQTPLIGPAAKHLRVGDRVWLRHTKSGEPMEHANHVVPVLDSAALEDLDTYRGEGKCWL
ncbi:MAG: alanine racemase [Leucobacter sp.]|jgi:D-serine deaminase-like pyridoxal phosphate-dependent protein